MTINMMSIVAINAYTSTRRNTYVSMAKCMNNGTNANIKGWSMTMDKNSSANQNEYANEAEHQTRDSL